MYSFPIRKKNHYYLIDMLEKLLKRIFCYLTELEKYQEARPNFLYMI